MELRGRIALITGAARRVGRAVALRLAEHGCHVALHYHISAADAEQTQAQCRERGARAERFAADLANTEQTRQLVGDVLSRFGRLDVLVNNASVFEPMTLEGFDLGGWEYTLRVNLTAPMILAHAARDSLLQARGRIVNLCDAAVGRGWPDHIAYVVSKGALETLTRTLARAFAPHVNVVGVAPGVAAWPDSYDEQRRARLTARIPLGRAGSPEEIAAAVCFLLAEGDYITGAVIPVDGGRHVV